MDGHSIVFADGCNRRGPACRPAPSSSRPSAAQSINGTHGIASAFSPRHRGIAYHLSHPHGSLARGYASATAWVRSAGRHRLGRTTEAHSETAARCAVSCRGTVSHRSHSSCGAALVLIRGAVVRGFCMAQKQQRRQCHLLLHEPLRLQQLLLYRVRVHRSLPVPHAAPRALYSRVLPSNLSSPQTGRRPRRAGAQAYQCDHMRKHCSDTGARAHTRVSVGARAMGGGGNASLRRAHLAGRLGSLGKRRRRRLRRPCGANARLV